MNHIIEEQLKKIQVAKVASHEGDTFIFKKHEEFTFNVGEQHIIKLADSLLDRTQNIVLVENWNQCRVPTSKYYLVNIIQVMNNMIKVSGVEYNIIDNTSNEQVMFTGWLPIEKIEVVK